MYYLMFCAGNVIVCTQEQVPTREGVEDSVQVYLVRHQLTVTHEHLQPAGRDGGTLFPELPSRGKLRLWKPALNFGSRGPAVLVRGFL